MIFFVKTEHYTVNILDKYFICNINRLQIALYPYITLKNDQFKAHDYIL